MSTAPFGKALLRLAAWDFIPMNPGQGVEQQSGRSSQQRSESLAPIHLNVFLEQSHARRQNQPVGAENHRDDLHFLELVESFHFVSESLPFLILLRKPSNHLSLVIATSMMRPSSFPTSRKMSKHLGTFSASSSCLRTHLSIMVVVFLLVATFPNTSLVHVSSHNLCFSAKCLVD